MLRSFAASFALVAGLGASAFASTPQWIEVHSPHFTVISDSGDKSSRHVLDQLERMRWVFQKLYPKANVDPPEPILVFAAKNEKTFQTVEPAAYLAKGSLSLAGYFLNTQDQCYVLLRLDAQEEEHPFATVYHEYTHLQFRNDGEWIPLWLNEGIAEFFQNTTIRQKDVWVGQPDANNILYLRQQKLIPLPVLFKVDASSPYYHEEKKGSVFYAESWALTHYLEVTDHEKGTQKLAEYFQLMSHREDSLAAAQKAFGDLNQLQRDLEAYIRMGQYKQFVMNSAAAPIDESTYTSQPLTQLDADAVRAEILANVNRTQEARDLIAAILKADPNNARAQETMGSIEMGAGNLQEAAKLYKQAVQLDPKSYLANFHYAALAMQMGQADESAETSLRAAIEEKPDFAPAYDRLGGYYAMHRKNLQEALNLVTKAIKLDGGNFYYRMNAASILAQGGNTKDALAVLGAAEKIARTPEEVQQAQSRAEDVKRYAEVRARMAQQQAESEHARQTSDASASAPQTISVTNTPEKSKHPDEANGPKHTVAGVIHGATCAYPSVLELQVQTAGKTYSLYNNNFMKIDVTAVGFTPKDGLNPCKDLEGTKARVQYRESADTTTDGQVFAIEMHK